MKKIIYIISDIDKALAFEWIAISLDQSRFDLSFVLLNDGGSKLEDFLLKNKISVKRISTGSKKGFIKSYGSLASFLKSEKPDIIHCHLRNAELTALPLAFFLGIKRRIYTRHSSTYNHLYHPKGVWIDRITSKMATDIVAISKNVHNVLTEWENVNKKKVKLIPHGFDLEIFDSPPLFEVEELKRKYCVEGGYKVIGIVARYTWWKGYAYSIPAIGRIMKQYPNALLMIANANGNDRKAIKDLIKEHIPEDRLREIPFEPNLPALYKLFDYYVHVPFDATVEAFGQTYVEALAAGVPSVFTLSGIASEFIKDEYNALVVDFKNGEQIEIALKRMLNNESFCLKLIENGKSSVKTFSLKAFVQKLEELYSA